MNNFLNNIESLNLKIKYFRTKFKKCRMMFRKKSKD